MSLSSTGLACDDSMRCICMLFKGLPLGLDSRECEACPSKACSDTVLLQRVQEYIHAKSIYNSMVVSCDMAMHGGGVQASKSQHVMLISIYSRPKQHCADLMQYTWCQSILLCVHELVARLPTFVLPIILNPLSLHSICRNRPISADRISLFQIVLLPLPQMIFENFLVCSSCWTAFQMSSSAHHVEEHGVPDIHDVVAEVAAVRRLVIEAPAAKAAVVAVVARQAQVENRQHADLRAGLSARCVEERPDPVAIPAAAAPAVTPLLYLNPGDRHHRTPGTGNEPRRARLPMSACK